MISTRESIFTLLTHTSPEDFVKAVKEDLSVLNPIDLKKGERPLASLRFESSAAAVLALSLQSEALLKAAWCTEDTPRDAKFRVELFEAAAALAVEVIHRTNELSPTMQRMIGASVQNKFELKIERNWRRLIETLENESADSTIVAQARESHGIFTSIISDRFGVDLSTVSLPRFDALEAYGDA